MFGNVTVQGLRDLLKDGAELHISGRPQVVAFGVGGIDSADLQWLYDTAMEPGNSQGIVSEREDGSLDHVTFSQAGCCTLGIVCDVQFDRADIPAAALAKLEKSGDLYPEDMEGRDPSRVVVFYDESEDESLPSEYDEDAED